MASLSCNDYMENFHPDQPGTRHDITEMPTNQAGSVFIKRVITTLRYRVLRPLRSEPARGMQLQGQRCLHLGSTETALVKVHNDIVSAIDNQSYIILLLLDLSAAFDIVDHKILPQRLSCLFGINGKALRWFKSYLENRKQVVNVKGATSCRKDLRCGVPQGSVLEPILYVLYMSPLHCK